MTIPSDLIAFCVALLASLSLTAPIRHLALRFGMVDHPNPRKVHVKPIPLMGGIAIYLGFVLGVIATLRGAPHQQIVGVLAGATLLAIVGFIDDGGFLHHQVKLTRFMRMGGGSYSKSNAVPTAFVRKFTPIRSLVATARRAVSRVLLVGSRSKPSRSSRQLFLCQKTWRQTPCASGSSRKKPLISIG